MLFWPNRAVPNEQLIVPLWQAGEANQKLIRRMPYGKIKMQNCGTAARDWFEIGFVLGSFWV